ncbi:DUF1501 domain-containing protein [Nocardioides sp. ChNu-153]|uniref:DUF1501 domain-containing protein n=1 Tax=unclassified Nocardioides TaxID=2615069 RepID=UPI002404FE9E|nr:MULTISPECIES: DUF1501 domain-containing protein [unclassified Nocardioides]MDF9715288.1 DUF1501 domain-containing protein [Nocardioides sp. ChNu-99]MDN7122501.1 DUF1501 domain-containing protein [Nocardioides sp. ChNu-153]
MNQPRPATAPACCDEFAGVSRRTLLRGALLAGAAATFGGAVVNVSAGYAAAGTTPSDKVLVVLSLRGAADGLSLVVPHADPVYYRARPRIAVPAERLLAKDAMFGLHPGFAPLLPMWTAGKLAAVHATGLPAPNRSHFAAMEEVEDATAGSTTREGWLNRLLGQDASTHPLDGVAVGDGMVPTSLYGAEAVSAMRDPASLQLAGADQWDTFGGRRRSIQSLWGADSSALGTGVRSALAAVDDFAPVRALPTTPANGATYPNTDLGKALRHVAQVVRGDVGTKVVTVDQGDWDMHTDLGTLSWGGMQRNVADLAGAMAAFFTDLGALGDKVTLVTLSEFGRRVRENDNYGLDHGYGNVMLLAGAGVRGGRYLGSWPGLTDTADADLLVTTDYRSVLAEVVSRRFGASTAQVFPGFTPTRVGVML